MADSKDDDDSYFSDSVWDAPQSTYQALESNALSSTQHRIAAQRARDYKKNTKAFKLPVPNTTAIQNAAGTRPIAPSQSAPHSPDEYEFVHVMNEKDVIDMDARSLLGQPTSILPQRPALDQFGNAALVTNVDDVGRLYNRGAPPAPANDTHHYLRPAQTHPVHGSLHDQGAYEARIKELEQGMVELKQSLQDAKDAAFKSAGEARILRAKKDKDAKETQLIIAALQKSKADELAKQRLELEVARKQRETLETDARFREHDLVQVQVAERRKRPKPTKEPSGHNYREPDQLHGAVHQPGKGFSSRPSDLPHRDGFDDNEIVLVSPSKPKNKQKPDTPKVGDKRKRNVNASPIRPLLLETSVSKSSPSVPGVDEQETVEIVTVGHANAAESRFRTMQQIISHRPPEANERTLETLSKLYFPSTPGVSVASLVFDKLTCYVPTQGDQGLPLYVGRILLNLWSMCLEDQYYSPLQAIADLLEFVLALGPRSIANGLIEQFVPLAIKSIDLIAMPLARPPEHMQEANPTGRKTNKENSAALSEEINLDHIMGLAHDMAMTASFSAETTRLFWQKMEFDFALMMLNVPQQLPYMQLILQMVGVSVLPESFGVISQQPEKQSSLETHTVDRLTNLLFEQPKAPVDEPPYRESELASLRIEAVCTLSAIAGTNHGSTVIAQHKTAVGRLFRFLHNQVTALYDLPSSSIDMAGDGLVARPSTIRKLTTTLISATIRLIHHLLHNHADIINLREKMAVIPGGHHKFLVSLTRLAFSEQLVYEAGIDEEAVDAAHEILDHVLSPEEGDAVVEAIETPRGSAATRTSAPR